MQTKSQRVQIPVGEASMPAYLSRPEAPGKYPGVIVFMEIFGVNHHIRAVADRVAALGYVVLAPEPFHRTAPGIELGYDEEGMARGIELAGLVKPDELMADAKAAYDFLVGREDVGGKGIGAMGFCFGGLLTYLTACQFPVAAAASFYGGGIVPRGIVSMTPGIRGRMLCLFAENDTHIPLSDVEAVRAALVAAGTRHEVVVYPGTAHGFFCDERAGYDKDAAADAWTRVVALFDEELR